MTVQTLTESSVKLTVLSSFYEPNCDDNKSRAGSTDKQQL